MHYYNNLTALDVDFETSGTNTFGTTEATNEAIGVDINKRAALLARLNVKLNLNHSIIYEQDIFTRGKITGLFDVITWDMPFMFLPESENDINLDEYGRYMGIELTLRFISEVSSILSKNGECWLQLF